MLPSSVSIGARPPLPLRWRKSSNNCSGRTNRRVGIAQTSSFGAKFFPSDGHSECFFAAEGHWSTSGRLLDGNGIGRKAAGFRPVDRGVDAHSQQTVMNCIVAGPPR